MAIISRFSRPQAALYWSPGLSLAVLLVVTLTFASFTSAAQLYRYKDDQGNQVLNHTIPPKYVPNGYEILNSQGRVIRVVAPALTPEQIAARDAAREAERLRKIEKAKQAEKDAELKQLYSHPDDAVRVYSRRIQDIVGVIQVKRSTIESTRQKILNEESKAAARQRKGLSVDEDTLTKIEKHKMEIANSQQDIVELSAEINKVKAELNSVIQRLETITRHKASDYQAKLKALEAQLNPATKGKTDQATSATEGAASTAKNAPSTPENAPSTP